MIVSASPSKMRSRWACQTGQGGPGIVGRAGHLRHAIVGRMLGQLAVRRSTTPLVTLSSSGSASKSATSASSDSSELGEVQHGVDGPLRLAAFGVVCDRLAIVLAVALGGFGVDRAHRLGRVAHQNGVVAREDAAARVVAFEAGAAHRADVGAVAASEPFGVAQLGQVEGAHNGAQEPTRRRPP